MINKKLVQGVNFEDKKDVDALLERLLGKMERENKTLQEVLNVDNSALEELYSVAYAHYNQGKYKEALHLFRMLVNIAPRNAKFLFGLASSFYQLEDYENAAISFSFSLYQDPNNALTAYYTSDCFIKKGEVKAALEMLNIAIEIADDQKEYAALKQRCLLIKNTLKM